MALPAAGVLEIRSGGSSTNGGGFVAGGSGVDHSQQDSPQYSVTDGVANGTTTLTSATANFGTDVVDNYVSVSGGTGSITQRWKRIVSRTNATTIVVDSSTGLTAGTGVTLKIGGALASPATAASLVVAGNTVYWKDTATYTTAALIALSVSGTDGKPITWIGYTTTRGDNGQVTIRATGAMSSVLEVSGAGNILRNITADGNSVATYGIYASGSQITLDGCKGMGATDAGIAVIDSGTVKRCLATGNGSSTAHAGFSALLGAPVTFDRCVARGNGGNGFAVISAAGKLVNCLSHENALSGVYVDSGAPGMIGCTLYGNTLDGLRFGTTSALDAQTLVRDCLFASNGGYGMRSLTTDYSVYTTLAILFENNAFYNNTLGARFQVPTGASDITLTADPFLDAASDDFGLNLAVGGGLSLRGAGVPGTAGFGLRSAPEPSDAVTDVGAVTSSGMATSGTSIVSTIATMRQLWRKLTGEVHSHVPEDAEIDEVWIQRGLEDLNRLLRYHYTDDATSLTLVAGQQEYTAPADCNEIIHIYLGGQELKKSDIREWRNHGIAWRQASGTPQEWALYGDKIVFFPTPDAAAVAADDNPDIRYVSNPRAFGTYGAEQLRAQDVALPVYRAVTLWSASYPDSALAQGRLAHYDARFEKEAALVAAYYSARLLEP